MQTKQRHGCLTAWLIMMMIGNASAALLYLLAEPKQLPNSAIQLNSTTTSLLCLVALINLSFAIGLWFWKKWAFRGFILTGILMFFTNLNMGIGIANASIGLFGVIVMIFVLQIKRDGKNGWENLD
jgi:hypothetical protein